MHCIIYYYEASRWDRSPRDSQAPDLKIFTPNFGTTHILTKNHRRSSAIAGISLFYQNKSIGTTFAVRASPVVEIGWTGPENGFRFRVRVLFSMKNDDFNQAGPALRSRKKKNPFGVNVF